MTTTPAHTGLLNIGDGPQTTAVALLLLRKMAGADAALAKALLELGALQQLHASRASVPPPPAEAAGAAADAEGGQAQAGAAAGAADAPPAPAVLVVPGIWPEELLPSVRDLASLLLLGQPTSGHAASSSRSHQQQQPGVPTAHQHHRTGSTASSVMSTAAADAAAGPDGAADAAAVPGRPGASSGVVAAAAATGAAAPDGMDVLDERLLRAKARADWRQHDAARGSAAGAAGGALLPAAGADAPVHLHEQRR